MITVAVDLSQFDAAPLTAFAATKKFILNNDLLTDARHTRGGPQESRVCVKSTLSTEVQYALANLFFRHPGSSRSSNLREKESLYAVLAGFINVR